MVWSVILGESDGATTDVCGQGAPRSATGKEVQLVAVVQMAKLTPIWTGLGMAVLDERTREPWHCAGMLAGRELIIYSRPLMEAMPMIGLIAKAG